MGSASLAVFHCTQTDTGCTMKLAVMSDIHDREDHLARAIEQASPADALIFCGDFCAPFMLSQLAEGFQRPVHAIFGNNDGDRFLLSQIAARFPHVTLYGEFMEEQFGTARVAAIHFPEPARYIAMSGAFQAVFYGHNHHHKIEQIGGTDFINPGEVLGRLEPPRFIIYDTENRSTQVIPVDGHG